MMTNPSGDLPYSVRQVGVMAGNDARPSLKLLSSMAHAVGEPSFERLTTEQRQRALIAALLVQQTSVLQDIVAALKREGE